MTSSSFATPLELVALAEQARHMPIPSLVVPAEFRGRNDAGGLASVSVTDESSAAWVAERLAWCSAASERITRARKEARARLDAAYDAALRVACAIESAAAAAGWQAELSRWTAANLPRRKRSIDLLPARVGFRADAGGPERDADASPEAEAALRRWAEQHIGLNAVEYVPRLRWAIVKAWLTEHGSALGDGACVVRGADGSEMVVPGVIWRQPEDSFYVRAAT